MLLYDTPVGLLGVAYLVLLLIIYLLQPSSQGYLWYINQQVSATTSSAVSQMSQGAVPQPSSSSRRRRKGWLRAAASQAVVPGAPAAAAAHVGLSESSIDLEQPLLAGFSTSSSLPGACARATGAVADLPALGGVPPGGIWPQHLRWLLLCLLTVLCAADLLSQYVLVVGSVVQEAPLLPPKWSAWVRDVVGIDAAATGGHLMLALMRPTCLLALQCALR